MGELSFGAYRLDTQKGRLYHQDEPLELEPQIYGILEVLVTRHGEIVSRHEIIDAVWDGRLVSNNVIDNRIKSARAAIGDNGKDQRYIKTYPNRGYKFIGKLSPADEIASPSELLSSSIVLNSSSPLSRKSPFFFQKSIVLKVAAAAVIAVSGFFILSESTHSGITQIPIVSEGNNDTAVYNLATSDDPNALPRVAVLPFEAIGYKYDYDYLPEILRSEFNTTITAIDGITVVGLSSGAAFEASLQDYDILKKAFDLDYVIASKMLPYKKAFKLSVSLVDLENGAVLLNQPFDLDVADKDSLDDLPALIARKITLLTANKLSLSVDRLPPYWQNYDFYKKYEEAKRIGARRDYESLKTSLELLREVMAEEPDFIPAYATFLKFLSTQVLYHREDENALFKEQAEVGRKMNEIGPEAPETLIFNAIMREYNAGNFTRSLRAYDPRNKVSVAEYILKTDPDNFEAHLILSRYSNGYRSKAETIEALERTLRLMPTNPTVLSKYSSALFCNEELDKARAVLNKASQWHPDHRDILVAEIKYRRSIGDYGTALVKTRQLLQQGYVTTNEVISLSALFFDLGHPELALPHVRHSSYKAAVYARMGDKEATIKEASELEHKSTGYNSRMMVDDDYVPDYYLKKYKFKRLDPMGEPISRLCNLREVIRKAHNFKHLDPANYEEIGSVNYNGILPVLTEHYKDKDLTDFRIQEEFTSLMGLHLLEGHPDKAIEVMDAAMERGFLFLGTFKEPYLRELKSHPGFAERLERMQKSADLLVEKYYTD